MNESLLSESGILITLVLITVPLIVASILVIIRTKSFLKRRERVQDLKDVNAKLQELDEQGVAALEKREKQLDYRLTDTELSGDFEPNDQRGLLDNVGEADELKLLVAKKKGKPRSSIDAKSTKLILWFLTTATFWLILGTTIGEYLGIKFVAPDIDHKPWLSFGRLRPVHTNMVFWGWASLAMLGLGYYVVPRVSNNAVRSVRKGYISLVLVNATVLLGTILLMAGVNNGGGEYREYIWPVMLLFGIGVFVSLINFIGTVKRRKSKEIYVSNWYIVSALMYLLVITVVAYWPTWQNGLGETIIQGYYMHQGVGMWFMLFCLGLMYYFLPQQLNRPIYSYGLGILAFWTQILFYTLIGTHHFIFSSIPWWMQTVAIVGSVGMVIPVVAGTTNFLLTFRGAWNKVANSYTLPFYLVSIIFYFCGSLQGTAEAFRFTNLIWHFTDFTVAHSHLTMYGIICFMLWAFIYTLVPRLTGKEPVQGLVGAHFWLAFIGLLFYTIPLMIGATGRGLLWLDEVPFIDSVKHMAPFWLWRAIGGSIMWISHFIFAFNLYWMCRKGQEEIEVPRSPSELLKAREELLRSQNLKPQTP